MRGRERAQLPFLSLALLIPALILATSPDWSLPSEYSRSAIRSGEVWRLIACHWTHWNFYHLIWDVLVFAWLAAAIERESRVRLLTLTASSAFMISASLWWLAPNMSEYRGLSGIAAAYWAYVAMQGRFARQGAERWVGGMLMFGLAAKVALEFFGGAVLVIGDAAGFGPAPVAHACGGVLGVGAGAVGCWMKRDGRAEFRSSTAPAV